jgi:hypothetical protein
MKEQIPKPSLFIPENSTLAGVVFKRGQGLRLLIPGRERPIKICETLIPFPQARLHPASSNLHPLITKR